MYAYELFKLRLSDFDDLAKTMSRAEYCCTLGQWYAFTAPTDDSVEQAAKWLREAASLGDAEAKLHLANMYRLGDLGKVDIEQYLSLLNEAVEGGSQLAEIRLCKDIAYGVMQKPDLDKGIEEAERRVAVHPNPDARWYDAIGWMKFAKDDFVVANSLFLKAIEMGYVDSYTGLIDMPEKQQEGLEAVCGGCYLLKANELKEKFNENSTTDTNAVECFSDDEQKKAYLEANYNYRKELALQIESLYEEAAKLGEPIGLFYLGMLYYKAQYNHYEDDEKAFDFFMRGNRLGDFNCMSMLADMILEGCAPDEYSYEDACFFQLKALRYGDEDMLLPVMQAYFEGDLDEYKDEIESQYKPLYDALGTEVGGLDDWPDDGIDDKEAEDDDGRYDAWA